MPQQGRSIENPRSILFLYVTRASVNVGWVSVSQWGQRQPGFQNEVPGRLKIKAELRAGRRAAPLPRCLPATDLVTRTKPWRVVCANPWDNATIVLPELGSLAVDVPNLA